ncbi:squalene synthase HpnC [Methylophaga sp.]|uniref:squalene synthase HpnC n=1 Tax=Methylophaga sp. TaxID=2024840 RepID=UPI003F6963C8
MTSKLELDKAYGFCQRLAQSHYENFPVASLLLPQRLRKPISVIYAFARTADDFADEGNAPQHIRLAQLDAYSDALKEIDKKTYKGNDAIFIALADVIHRHQLSLCLFEDLLLAFRQDVVKSRYANFDEVLEYCRYSANPVGRLLLQLEGDPSEAQLKQSDAVCSALQLINFYQDIVQDYSEQDRIYIPLDELSAAGLSEFDLIQPDSEKIAPLVRSLYQRTANMMQAGFPLGESLNGRLGWEVRAMTLAGIKTLSLLIKQPDKALLTRPRLKKTTLISIMLNALSKRLYRTCCSRLLNLKGQ